MRDNKKILGVLFSALSHSRVPRFFLISATVLSVLYIAQLPLFFNQYPHQTQRLFHVVSSAYSIVYGQDNRLPVSVYALKDFPYKASCERWPQTANQSYCADSSVGNKKKRMTFSECLDIPLNPYETMNFNAHRDATVFPLLSYSPYLIVAIISLWLQVSPIFLLYGGVVLNSVLVTAIGYYTLRFLPVLRWAVCYLLLLPIGMMFRLYTMPDALAIELCYMLFASAVAFALKKQTLKTISLIYLVTLASLAGVFKIGYGLYSLVFLLIPARCFGGRLRRITLLMISLLVVLAVSVAWGVSYQIQESRKEIDAAAIYSSVVNKMQYIFAHPLIYTKAVLSAVTNRQGLISGARNLLYWPHHNNKINLVAYIVFGAEVAKV